MPTPGFDMLDVMGLHKDELLSLFGDPDQYYFQEEHGGEMFYEYLGATFYYTPGSEIVDAITITAIYEDYGYGLMDIYVGSSFDQVESWLGAPDYEGYDELFTEAGMPSYGMHYFLENGYPGLEGQLNLFFFAESADRPISQIYALWFE